MKKSTATILAIFFLSLPAAFAVQSTGQQNSGPSLGIILGSPTGLTFKYVFARSSAVAANAGWAFVEQGGSVHLTCDYQFLFPQTMTWTDDFEGTSHQVNGLCPYVGLGGRLLIAENNVNHNTEFHVGLRLGGGIEYAFSRFALFLEIYPVVNLIPSTEMDFEGGLGFRFYFGK
jgi:hypothetical protein